MLMIFALCFTLVYAKQIKHNVEKNSDNWVFTTTWDDVKGNKHQAKYTLDSQLIKLDIEEPLKYQKNKSAKYSAAKINAWGKKQKGVTVRAAAKKGKVSIRVSGKLNKVRPTLKKAEAVGNKAQKEYMDQEGYTYLRQGGKKGIIPDHLKHIEEYSKLLGPLVEALGGPTADPRAFGFKALSFVQNIPYEKRALVSDRYRRPFSLLGRNKGDCDSKAVLYLALMKAAYPDMPVAMVYIRGHAFGALGIEPQKGDMRFKQGEHKFVLVEPVGPKMVKIGKVGPKSRRHFRSKMYKAKVLE